jgi:hypothetical protein
MTASGLESGEGDDRRLARLNLGASWSLRTPRAESVRVARVDIETAASLPQVLVAGLLYSPMAAATNLRLVDLEVHTR